MAIVVDKSRPAANSDNHMRTLQSVADPHITTFSDEDLVTIIAFPGSDSLKASSGPAYVPDQDMTNTASGANLAAIGHAVNTTGKWPGKGIWNTTVGAMYFSTGSLPASTWVKWDKTATITPV